jgi:uncharacterized protein (DUF433 family)
VTTAGRVGKRTSRRSFSVGERCPSAGSRPTLLDPRAAKAQDWQMETPVITYVEQRDGVHMLAGTRVSLDSIVSEFLSGQSAESIAQAFPVLVLEQVYGAIAFYLAHRDDVDDYLEARQRDFDAKRDAAREADPMFYQKLADAKKQTLLAR